LTGWGDDLPSVFMARPRKVQSVAASWSVSVTRKPNRLKPPWPHKRTKRPVLSHSNKIFPVKFYINATQLGPLKQAIEQKSAPWKNK